MPISSSYKWIKWLPFIAGLLFVLAVLCERGLLLNSTDKVNKEDGDKLGLFLEKKTNFIKEKLSAHELNDSLTLSEDFKQSLEDNNVLYSLIEGYEEINWQNNSFDFDINSNDSAVSLKLVDNGWYIMGFKTRGKQKLVLYYQFFFKNYKNSDAIKFEFNKDVPVKREIEFQPKPEEESFYLYKIEDLVITGRFLKPPHRKNSLVFYGFFVLVSLLYLLAINFEKGIFNNWRFVKQYVVFMLVLRILYYFRSLILLELRNTTFFSPEVYASNIFSSSVGDITLDILILLPVVLYLNHEYNPLIAWFRIQFKNRKVLSEVLLNLSIIFICLALTNFIKQLVLNSVISFSLYHAESINLYTYVGVFLLFLLILIVSFLTFALCRMFGRDISKSNKWAILLSFFTLLTIASFLFEALVVWTAMLAYVFLYFFTRIHNIKKKVFTPFLYVVFFNLLVTVLISYFIDFKEKEHRKIFAIKALFGFDIEAEDLLLNSDEKIANDESILAYFKNYKTDNDKITTNLKHSYFTGYLNKYDLLIEDYSLENGKPSDKQKDYYDKINLEFENAGRSIGENYRAISSKNNAGDYMGRFYIASDSLINGALFITFKAKAKIRETNFYSSIISSQMIDDDVKGYSYALYERNKLVKSFGDFNYPVFSDKKNVIGNHFEKSGKYSHLIYSEDGVTKLVVTNSLMSFTEWVSIFLVLVLYVIIISTLLLFLLIGLLFLSRRFDRYSVFKNLEIGLLKIMPFLDTRNIFLSVKLQLAMFGIIILTFAVTLTITMNYVSKNYYNRQEVVLKEKMFRLVKSLESDNKKDIIQKEKEIYALSYERGLDINVYDKDGDLLISSNNVIFNEGLIGPKLNRDVFNYFEKTKTHEYQNNEELGSLKFLSAYYAFYDKNYNIDYFINVPYFTQKSELDREISSYVVSLINFYGIVLIISFVIAYFLSRKLAEPLVMIREYMGGIRLGKQNKQIVWKNKDEIGLLVHKYNEMLKEIEDNALKLASNEREGAWQEMAKQVAHEIKNPLTPMKLQVQMLQKAWRNQDPGLNDKFERVSSLLLERMDAMAEMAIQFSSFSKMPKTKLENIQLNEVLSDMVDLQSGDDNFKIIMKEFPEFTIKVDKEQLARVFTNLIQNARQAIKEGEKGKLAINAFIKDENVICTFEDNGCGISEENGKNIFVPNFSTKNSGMGMGLAISKKIIETFEGKLYFTSQENKGTTFYVLLPLVKE